MIRLICRHTVEEVILTRAEAKMRLTNAVIGSQEEAAEGKNKITAADITNMITCGLRQISNNVNDHLKHENNQEISDQVFTRLIGDTDDSGYWLPFTPQADANNGDLSNAVQEGTSIYYYEGTDYKGNYKPNDADLAAMAAIVESAKDTLAKPIPPAATFDDDESKERELKRQEHLAEQRQKRRDAAVQKQQRLWLENS